MPVAQKTRPEKTDFEPLYTEHRRILEDHGLNIDKMIELRRFIHKHPEGEFDVFKTQKLIRDKLLEFGLEPEAIKDCIKSGLVVDIHGTGPEEAKGHGLINSIALRADMDGLPIKEMNEDLEYKSTTEWAHMCGHDGHMTTILSAAYVIITNRDKIPCNNFVRLLFQPAEEAPGGALPMIKEGCLEGIQEIYGYHNVPNFDQGDVRVCEGAFFAAGSKVTITVKGQGGHGSSPHKLVDPIVCAA